MGGFRVDDQAVDGLAGQQGRLGEDANAGRTYLAAHTDLAWNGEGLINLLAGGHRDARALAERFHETLNTRSATPGQEAFRAAAAYYRRTDGESAERYDRTYPPRDPAEARKGLPDLRLAVPPNRDPHEPTARYTTPPDHNAEFPHEPAITDLLSPTALARDAIWTVTDLAAKLGFLDRAYDPLDSFVKPISGDWAALRGCADVYHNVAAALGDMAENTTWAGDRLDDFWEGNAADGAQTYLYQLARSVGVAQAPFDELAEQYKAVAQGAADVGDLVGGLICDLIDAVLIAIAAAEGAAISAGTIVGIPLAVVIADVALVAEIIKCVQIVLKILEVIDKVNKVIDVFNLAAGNFGRVVVPENLRQLSPQGAPANLPR